MRTKNFFICFCGCELVVLYKMPVDHIIQPIHLQDRFHSQRIQKKINKMPLTSFATTRVSPKPYKKKQNETTLTSLFVSVNFKAESGYRISQDDNISRTHLSSTRQAESELDPERRELLDRWKLTEDPAVRYPVKTASIWREEWMWKVFCSCCI